MRSATAPPRPTRRPARPLGGFSTPDAPRKSSSSEGATEAINLVAQTFGRQHVGPGDEVLISEMEHHANLVPWQQLCRQQGARLVAAPIDDRGELRLDALESLISPRTKLIALSHVSNALGTVNPVKKVIEAAHTPRRSRADRRAQAAPHVAVDVQDLGCDFYVFSGHKVYGPMGVGVLYGRLERLESMPPWQHGGDMVDTVGLDATTFAAPPYRFEAGTPNVAGAVGLAAALEFLEGGRPPRRRRPRAGAAGSGRSPAFGDPRRAAGGRAGASGRGGLVHDRRSADVGARRLGPARRRGDRRPGGQPLLPAADGPARRLGDRPGLVRGLQRRRRRRPPRRRRPLHRGRGRRRASRSRTHRRGRLPRSRRGRPSRPPRPSCSTSSTASTTGPSGTSS